MSVKVAEGIALAKAGIDTQPPEAVERLINQCEALTNLIQNAKFSTDEEWEQEHPVRV